MFLLDALNDIFTLAQGLIIDIPLNNPLSILYVVINFVIQIGAILLGGEVELPGTGGGGL